jgi:hypothetical protein
MSHTHDPKRILEALRDHLTHAETNVAFLFGAGTSSAVRVPLPGADPPATRSLIPNVAELTAICRSEIEKLDSGGGDPRFKAALATIEQESAPEGRPANIEDILSCVRRKLHAIGEGDRLSGLDRQDLAQLEETIRRTIATKVNPDTADFPERLPHEDFVRWVARMPRRQPVEVFTTNYDILLERAFDTERVPSFDGFVGCEEPFFCHETLTRPEAGPGPGWARIETLTRPEAGPGPGWARIWKIHGSITWTLADVKGRPRVVRTRPHSGGEMIMPSHHKYDESRKQPYSAILDRLTRVLEREDTNLVVCGYSFSDEHINAIIFGALEARQRTHVIALQYADAADGDVLSRRADQFHNLMLLGPTAATVGGRRGGWKANDVRSIERFGDWFAADPPAEGGKDPPGTGKLLLGDFNTFSHFLGSLAVRA